MMTVDLSSTLGLLLALMSAAVTAAAPFLIIMLQKKTASIKNEEVRNLANDALSGVNRLAKQAAGIGYNWAVTESKNLAHPEVSSAAVAQGLNFIATIAPGIATQAGLTPDMVAAKVQAEMGLLMGADPNVTATNPVTVASASPVITPAPTLVASSLVLDPVKTPGS